MKYYVVILAGTWILIAHGPTASAQDLKDLLDRAKVEKTAATGSNRKVSIHPDRVDLRLSQNVVPSVTGRRRGGGEVGISANMDLDFICGQFDLKTTFKHLLGKEAREEFLSGALGMIESEVAGSAMELLCQAQPTLCTLLQNHNIAANLKLGYHYDRCAAIENAIDNAQKRVYASAIDQCLKEKKERGVPFDEALDSCRKAERVRGFGGESLVEFDLAKELSKLAGLSGEAQKLLEGVSEETKYGGTWSSARPNGGVVAERHERIKGEYLEGWGKAVEEARRGGSIGEEELAKLAPPGAPPVLEREVRSLARLPEDERAAAMNSLASAAALAQLTIEIHDVERAMEAVAGVPSIEEAQRKMLEGRLGRLRKERARLEELYRDQGFWQEAYRSVLALGKRNEAERIAAEREKAAAAPAKREMLARTAPWGSRGPAKAPSPSRPGGGNLNDPSCGGCNGFEFSVGSSSTGGTR
jgi:hypothetical protein